MHIVPAIKDSFPQVYAVYVFCFDIVRQLNWALKCIDTGFLMFDDDIKLRLRIIRDMGQYFIEKGCEYLKLNVATRALEYFTAAKRLFIRANKLEREDYVTHIDLLEQILIPLAEEQQTKSECDDDGKNAVECDLL
ncbi:unnamed protein product [Didymodactylos carnosus]|uniref:Uncharacterized protein n=1 Tax=Didymodactylos carnosus TaxID=1234261 RepID=A0A815KQ49_9BILA|nr:unnamed protein product [Didymodactylos carnosus]CAF1495504.1 unnamed protein product [Didymodactylos carnosus]CAF4284536.1 unnamed protein product [Didymodactylos carnosus]CAF4292597.1 unnamed protein product [Didymodactylos carnosus]